MGVKKNLLELNIYFVIISTEDTDFFTYFVLGQVTDLKDVVVTQIALGKAHTVVLTDRGQVFTFGINNKGQCGRDFQPGGNKEGIYNFSDDFFSVIIPPLHRMGYTVLSLSILPSVPRYFCHIFLSNY